MTETAAIPLAIEWLSHSGIRYDNGHELANGGVNRGYDWTNGQYEYIYSEITGYAVSAFVNSYRWTGEEKYLSLARQSADYVMRVQNQHQDPRTLGGIPHSVSLTSHEINHKYYSFDTAICLQGLLDLYAVEPTPALKSASEAIGTWLHQQTQLEDGAFLAVYDPDAQKDDGFFSGEDPVYGDAGCLHAKHAIGLLKLHGVTGNAEFAESGKRVCDWLMGLQNDAGSFQASYRTKEVHSHPHCYATEGLLYAYYHLNEEKYIQSARRAAQWLLNVQNSDGSINIAYKREWWRMGRRIKEIVFPRRVSDATSQSARIWLTLYYLDGDSRYLEAARKATQFLTQMQATTTSDTNAKGGFHYWWPEYPVMFAWCTMFALHALYAVENSAREQGYEKMMIELF